MKYAAGLVCVVLLLSVVSAFAYEPVSDVETAALRSGLTTVACNDVTRPYSTAWGGSWRWGLWEGARPARRRPDMEAGGGCGVAAGCPC